MKNKIRWLVKLSVFFLCLLALFSCKKTMKLDTEYLSTIDEVDWPLYGNSAQRTNYVATSIKPPLKNIWEYKASSAIGASLVTANGIVYANTLDGRLDAIDIKTGDRIGQVKIDENIEATCVFFNGDLFIASRYGVETLMRMDLKKAKILWRIDAGDIATEPVLDETGIYVSAIYHHIDKYELETGEQLWSYKTEDQLHSSPALAENTLVVGSDDGTIYALNAKTGILKWQLKTGAAIFSTPVIFEQQVFIGGLDSTFYAINLLDGAVDWKFKIDYPIFQTAAINPKGNVFFGDSNGSVYCLSQESGKLQWKFKAYSSISTAPLIAGDVIYFGSLDQKYYALSVSDGNELWNFTTKGRIRTSPVIWQDYLIGASEDKYIFCFQPEKEIVNK